MKYNLSDMQREKPKEPFTLEGVGPESGKVDVEFVNPKSLHWTVLTALDDMSPSAAISTLVPDRDQYAAFTADPSIDGEALEWVMEQWRSHFGLGAQGESVGSAGS